MFNGTASSEAPVTQADMAASSRPVADALRARTGWRLPQGVPDALVAERCQALGCDEASYARRLAVADHLEVAWLAERLADTSTGFYRQFEQLIDLAQRVVPGVVARQRQVARPQFRLWSVGCSSGAEAWGAAAVLLSALPTSPSWDISVLATDISLKALAQVQGGHPAAEVDALPRNLRDAVFNPPDADGRCRPLAVARGLVHPAYLNLMDPWDHLGTFDCIICRNVVGSFTAQARTEILGRLLMRLKPGASLYLGPDEDLPPTRGVQRLSLNTFVARPEIR